MPFISTWMDLEIIILSEANQREEEKNHMTSLTCGIQNKGTNELIYKAETELKVQEINLRLPGKREGKDKLKGCDIHTTINKIDNY